MTSIPLCSAARRRVEPVPSCQIIEGGPQGIHEYLQQEEDFVGGLFDTLQ